MLRIDVFIQISGLDLPVKYLEIERKILIAQMLNGKDNYGKQMFTLLLIRLGLFYNRRFTP